MTTTNLIETLKSLTTQLEQSQSTEISQENIDLLVEGLIDCIEQKITQLIEVTEYDLTLSYDNRIEIDYISEVQLDTNELSEILEIQIKRWIESRSN